MHLSPHLKEVPATLLHFFIFIFIFFPKKLNKTGRKEKQESLAQEVLEIPWNSQLQELGEEPWRQPCGSAYLLCICCKRLDLPLDYLGA